MLIKPASKTDVDAYLHSKLELVTSIDGQNIEVTAAIRRPFACDDEQWLCAASISGLFHRKADLHGATPEEAVHAAQRFVRHELQGFIANGGELKHRDQSPIGAVHKLFGLVPDTPDAHPKITCDRWR